eukprot:33395_1
MGLFRLPAQLGTRALWRRLPRVVGVGPTGADEQDEAATRIKGHQALAPALTLNTFPFLSLSLQVLELDTNLSASFTTIQTFAALYWVG